MVFQQISRLLRLKMYIPVVSDGSVMPDLGLYTYMH